MDHSKTTYVTEQGKISGERVNIQINFTVLTNLIFFLNKKKIVKTLFYLLELFLYIFFFHIAKSFFFLFFSFFFLASFLFLFIYFLASDQSFFFTCMMQLATHSGANVAIWQTYQRSTSSDAIFRNLRTLWGLINGLWVCITNQNEQK